MVSLTKTGTMINKFDIWLASLNPVRGIEVGKIRPVIVVQSNALNEFHPTIIVCPLSSNPWSETTYHFIVPTNELGLDRESVILLDQMRAADKSRFIKKIGALPNEYHGSINQKLQIILDLT